MIEANALVKCFGDFTALSSLTTTIRDSSIYGLVGSNGSGKSTFLRLVAGVYMPDGGTIRVDGEEVYENTAVKDRTFFVADDLYFLPQSSMNDMAKFYKGIFSGFSDERYAKLCTIFPLDPKKKINTFSKGMKRQAALLLGLSCQPDLLLLDEAFDGLDPVMRGAVKKLLSDDIAARDMTVIITSHNLRELEDLCDHVGLLHKGQILFEREIDELKLGFCKVHAAFPQGVDDQIFKKLDIMQMSRSGSLVNLVVRGTSADAAAYLLEQGAVFAEGVPLTLEEVFIHEMEAVGYDYNNIIF
ncbi:MULTISPECIES: ABC transporter ATP-binding protein [Anaerotruncus]|uniref:ABC transporter ATP-binding protein n=2 Tax=Oscillospiraceae TaxID=216572 RepID=UPI000E544F36|nr:MULTISPECIES: ABC transporter ATP-binding protein [Anaerotruncus]RGX54492.1 ABC transporter ATP-binding protein [Anaerotruncus sp. AF02-27]